MRTIRLFDADDLPAVLDIVRRLPDYFTDDVPDKVTADVGEHRGWVVVDHVGPRGFAVVQRRSPLVAEILWMAVDPVCRGTGLGTGLLDHIIDDLVTEGVSLVEVKTLDGSADYPPYEATRAFWGGRGFVHLDSIDPLPGWQPGNPCALYVRALHPTG
jgi:GNAT superfamily N-acetyltransferase